MNEVDDYSAYQQAFFDGLSGFGDTEFVKVMVPLSLENPLLFEKKYYLISQITLILKRKNLDISHF